MARGGFNQTVPKCFKYSASSRTRDEITSQITRRHEETRPRTHAARAAAPPRVHLPPLCQLLKRLHLPPPPGRLSLPRPSLWLLRSFLFSTQLLAGWLAGSWCPERTPLHLYPSQACGPSPVRLVQWIPCLGTDPVPTTMPTPLRTLSPHNVISPTVQKSSLYTYINIERDYLYIKMDGVIVTSAICLQILVQMPRD